MFLATKTIPSYEKCSYSLAATSRSHTVIVRREGNHHEKLFLKGYLKLMVQQFFNSLLVSQNQECFMQLIIPEPTFQVIQESHGKSYRLIVLKRLRRGK